MDDKLVRLSDVTAAMNSEGYTKNMRVHKKVLSIPAVDAVEVVRCGQCEHRKTFEDDFGNYIVCMKWKGFIADEDYCSWGQRREDGDGDDKR